MVKNILSLLSMRQNSILSGATILMLAVFGSKFLGLIKSRLLLHNFDTATTDIFFGAFKMPDLLFQILVFGALSVAFIPVFTDVLNKKGEDEAFYFSSNVLNLFLLFFSGVIVFAFIFTPFLNSIFLPGFSGETKALTDNGTRVILFSELVLVIGSFFIAIGQSYQRFIVPALASIFYNLGIILGIVFLSTPFGIMGPIYGVVLGAVLHMLIQIPLLVSLGFKYTLAFNFKNSGVKEIFRLMSVRNIGLMAEQINEVVSTALASLIAASSVTLLNLAQQLYLVPIGLFGATIAQAALPVLSKEVTKDETEAFKLTLLTTMHQILFLTLPAAAMLIVLRIPIVRLVFGAAQFNWTDTVITGRTLAYFSIGVAAQSVVLLLIRGFYALKDTKTPVVVSILSVLVNIFISVTFVQVMHFEVWSLGVAYAVATNLSFILLLVFLNKKIGGFDRQKLIFPAFKMILAAMVAAVALYIPIKALDQLVIDTTKTVNLIVLTSIASFFGLGIYLILVYLLEVEELATYINLIKRLTHLQNNIKTEELIQDPLTD
jgi:putative peptidoglycan lipid II flippase